MKPDMTVEDLITTVSGRSWEETLPYVGEFVAVVVRLMKKTNPKTVEDIIEIGAAVWSSMDVEHDISEVLDGEASGDVVSLRRVLIGDVVPRN